MFSADKAAMACATVNPELSRLANVQNEFRLIVGSLSHTALSSSASPPAGEDIALPTVCRVNSLGDCATFLERFESAPSIGHSSKESGKLEADLKGRTTGSIDDGKHAVAKVFELGRLFREKGPNVFSQCLGLPALTAADTLGSVNRPYIESSYSRNFWPFSRWLARKRLHSTLLGFSS